MQRLMFLASYVIKVVFMNLKVTGKVMPKQTEGYISHMCLTKLKKLTPLLLIALSLSAGTVSAEERSALSIRGFGTLGVARSSSPDVEFIRDLSQPKGIKDGQWSGRIDTVLGIQANWQINPELEAVGQVVSRYQYDASRDPALDWAFLKWVPDERVALRAGRIGADFMMLADSRLVGYSYLTVRPSVDFYGSLFSSSFDGIDGSLTLRLGDGLIRSKLFAGVLPEKVSGGPGVWDTSGSPIYGLVFDYFTGPWQFRASSTSVRFANDLNFTDLTDPLHAAAKATGISTAGFAADALSAKDTDSHYYTLGIVYDKGPLQVQAAVNEIDHETATFQNSQAGYLLAGYRINSITPYAGISRWKTKYKDHVTGLPDTLITPYGPVDFKPLNQAYQMLMDASGANQTTYTLGARWDVLPKIALKLQWDSVHGKAKSKFPYAKAQTDPGWDGRTDVISATLDFIF